MDDSSVFVQDVDPSDSLDGHPLTLVQEPSLNITTTAPGGAAPSSRASSDSRGSLYVAKTVTISHSAAAPPTNTGGSASRAAPVPQPRSSASPSQPQPAAGTCAPAAGPPVTTGKSGTSVRSAQQTSYAGPLRETPLVPGNLALGKGGVAPPQPLTAATRSQLRAAPTGGSDSDSEGCSDTASASPGRSAQRRTAEDDDEEEERRFVDEFGFVIDEDEKAEDERYVRGVDGRQTARREIKWANMAADWDRTNSKKHAKLKERCRKGIPSRLRGAAWQLLLGSRKLMMSHENEGVYVALRSKTLRDKEVDGVLGRDLTRTFPNHILFKDEGGVGQMFLRNVLHAYAGCDPEVGYTQGMAFVVGTLSTQMAEEEAFWALHELMYNERYKMRELYRPGFPLLHQFFYQLKQLIARLLPKLHKRFEELQIEPSFYASQWFMTLFVYHFPFRALLRIWDIFLSEGWKIIFRTGIALMKWEEKRLLAMSFEELLPALKELQDGKDAAELVRRAHRVKFKTAELNRYGDEYWAKLGMKPEV